MKPLRAVDVIHAVGVAGRAVRHSTPARPHPSHMLNSAGQCRRRVVCRIPLALPVEALAAARCERHRCRVRAAGNACRPAGVLLAAAARSRRSRDGLPRAAPAAGWPSKAPVPVARIRIHRARQRRLPADVPDPPHHPYGIEVRARHLNEAKQVSWHTIISMAMDVARRGAQFADTPSTSNSTHAAVRGAGILVHAAGPRGGSGQPVRLPRVLARTALGARQDVHSRAGDRSGLSPRRPMAAGFEPCHRGPHQSRGGVRTAVDERGATAPKGSRRTPLR